VVQVHDYVEQPGQGAAIIMELVNGVSLHQLIERQGTLAPEAACTVLKDALLGLAAAHTLGIVHRDYKPENVLIDQAGNTKLVDFGVAVRWGKQAPAAGTPLYLAPEEWHGAPASPATDIYAATAVFYECLTGRPPFSGKLLELQEQHVTAPVPLERVDEPLQDLIARGMAKNPAGRPPSAIAFVSELEALAAAVYGPGWEYRGRGELAERAAAVLPLLLRDDRPSASTRSYASTWKGGERKARIITIASIVAVLVVAVGAVAGVIALNGNGSSSANLSGNSTSQTAAANVPSSFSAVANVTPPVRVTACTTPSTFAYNATISSTGRGTMKYQWVYSSGKPGPVQTLTFTGPGKKVVTGETLSLTKAGNGWGKVNMVSPTAKTLDEASYQLLCNGSSGSQVSTAPTQSSPALTPAKSSPNPSPSTTSPIPSASTSTSAPAPSTSAPSPSPSPSTSSPVPVQSSPAPVQSSPATTPVKSSPSSIPTAPSSSLASPSPSLTVSSSPGKTASATPTLPASASAPASGTAPPSISSTASASAPATISIS
jgi:serine/threonine-protein kinase